MNCFFLASLLSALFLGLSQADKSEWGDRYKCEDGKKQSPIDIMDCDSLYDATKADAVFNWARGDDLKSVTIFNNGETAFLTGESFTEHTVLDSVEFIVDEINVHWGSPGQKGSEHAVDGVKYDGELEITLSKENATIYEIGRKIVVSIFLQEDSTLGEDIKILEGFKASLKEVVEPHSDVTIPFTEKTLSLDSLLPTDRSLYRYSGSMSTEPCEEGVERIVFKEPIKSLRLSLLS